MTRGIGRRAPGRQMDHQAIVTLRNEYLSKFLTVDDIGALENNRKSLEIVEISAKNLIGPKNACHAARQGRRNEAE